RIQFCSDLRSNLNSVKPGICSIDRICIPEQTIRRRTGQICQGSPRPSGKTTVRQNLIIQVRNGVDLQRYGAEVGGKGWTYLRLDGSQRSVQNPGKEVRHNVVALRS